MVPDGCLPFKALLQMDLCVCDYCDYLVSVVSLFCGFSVSAFRDWNYRRTPKPTQLLNGSWGPKPPSLHSCTAAL